MKSSLLVLFQIFFLYRIFAAPLHGEEDIEELKVEETDPELTGGYFQGDMILDDTRNGIVLETRRWPNRHVPYKLDEAFDIDHKRHILRAMNMIESVSCVRFYPATDDMENYVEILASTSGCNSNVGYLGRRQILRLIISPIDTQCFILGKIVHELMHTLGFQHEHDNPNRDDYVKIIEENIQDDKQIHFQKFKDNVVTDFGLGYDYKSIMHYPARAFSKNGRKTIVPIPDETVTIGQRRRMSKKDIDKLNIMYRCPLQT